MKKISIRVLRLMALVLFCSCCGGKADAERKNEKAGLPVSAQKQIAVKVSADSIEDYFAIHDLFTNEVNDVVNTIAEEKFSLALKKMDTYEKLNLTRTQKAYFRYMRIYSLTGLIVGRKRNKKELTKLFEDYDGLDIIINRQQITAGNHMPFNQVRVEQDSAKIIAITCANNARVNIFCFGRVHFKEKLDLTRHIGKNAYLGGKLYKFKISPDGVSSWISDFHLKEGYIKILEDEFSKK